MKLHFTSTSYLSGSELSVSISLPPFDIGSLEYLRWLNLLTRSRNEAYAHSVLDLSPRIVFSESIGPINDIAELERSTYDLNQAEQIQLRELISQIKVENIFDDLSDCVTCDGGNFYLKIETQGASVEIYRGNLNDGYRIVGLDDLLSLIYAFIEKYKLTHS